MVHRSAALYLILCFAGLSWGIGSNVILQAQEKPRLAKPFDFSGKWDGKYTPDRGVPGEGQYNFGAEKAGRWNITVSWVEDKATKSMDLCGERLGPNAVRLEGKYGDTTYWYIGRMEDQTLVLRYLSVNGKTGESGSGLSKLTRPK